jgi:hypothetical protein
MTADRIREGTQSFHISADALGGLRRHHMAVESEIRAAPAQDEDPQARTRGRLRDPTGGSGGSGGAEHFLAPQSPALFPGVAIRPIVLSLNLLGDGLRDNSGPPHEEPRSPRPLLIYSFDDPLSSDPCARHIRSLSQGDEHGRIT